MYNQDLYEYDKRKRDDSAKLKYGAVLYRLTSPNHNSFNEILNGRGPMNSPSHGRFNGPSQPTTYCSNNILVCLSEILFHNYYRTLKSIERKLPPGLIWSIVEETRCLTIIKVKEIPNLVYIDTDSVGLSYDARIAGTAVVNPDPYYAPYREFSDRIRTDKKRGVFYPSARHSKDFCIALFEDETSNIINNSYFKLLVKLCLLDENHDPHNAFGTCDPFKAKMHPTMGYYEFIEKNVFQDLINNKLVHPIDIPEKGMIDFVRRKYIQYPKDAIR